jgi:hypothetical protein
MPLLALNSRIGLFAAVELCGLRELNHNLRVTIDAMIEFLVRPR